MNNTSLLQVLNIFKDNALKHKMVETASFGTYTQFQERVKVNYKDIYFLFNSSTLTENKVIYNLTLIVSDLITSNDVNISNLWSTNHRVGEDIIYYTANKNRDDLMIDFTSISGQPLVGKTIDHIASIDFTFNVEVFRDMNGCFLPFND